MGIHERKEREKERRRQQIMVAAKRVFSMKGFTRATMEDMENGESCGTWSECDSEGQANGVGKIDLHLTNRDREISQESDECRANQDRIPLGGKPG